MNSEAGSERVAARMVAIGPEQAGQRIDNFLVTQLKGVPKSRIYRMLRRGEVRLNKGRVGPQQRLRDGDRVRIPPLRRSPVRQPPGASAWLLERLAAAVLYEDRRLLVLDKPAGVAVHGGSGVSLGVIEALRQARPEAPFLELVHRLDRDTSGCLVIAKRRSALRELHELIRADRVGKRYLALVRGTWEGGAFEVDVPLRKDRLQSGERMVRVGPDGKRALTRFRPLRTYAGQGSPPSRAASLMEVQLRTGRTHQIRVHAAHIGHPVAGDEKYGDQAFNRSMRQLGLKRLFLHAADIRFTPPSSGREIHVQAPLDAELETLLSRLET
jgi:23S rRNA pseudouridine955/2504/2580 synthase